MVGRQQDFHRRQSLAGSNKIIKHDYVTLFRQDIKRKHSIHALSRFA